MSRIVKVLKDTTINGVSYVAGDQIDLVATAQVEDYYNSYSFIIPRSKKEIELEMPDNFPVLSTLISPTSNMLEFDFTLLDAVESRSPHYARGKKIRSEYYIGDKIAASKDFTDEFNEDGVLSKLWVKFTWYNHLGEESFNKLQMVKRYNKFEAETEMRKRRERQIDFLTGAAKGTPQEQYLTFLLAHYRDLKNNYVMEGDLSWSAAIDQDLARDLSVLSPTNQQYYGTVKAILTADTDRIDDPTRTMKIHEALKYQMGTIEIED